MTAAVRWTLLTCLVAALSYSGAVTTFALLAFVLPSALVVGLVGAYNRASPVKALLVVVPTALVVAEVVNLVSGNDQGPAARSSFVAALGSGAALSLVGVGSASLLPIAFLLAGALALGAATEVGPVAVGTAALTVIALRASEASRWRQLARPRQGLMLVSVAIAVAGVGMSTLYLQQRIDSGPPFLPFPTVVDPDIHPGKRSVEPTLVPPASAPSEAPRASRDPASSSFSGQGLAEALAISFVGLVLLRLAYARLSWLRLRRRLSVHGATGVWLWVQAKRQSLGVALDPRLSPDGTADSGESSEALRSLSAVVSREVFGASHERSERLWRDADRVVAEGRESASRWARFVSHWVAAPSSRGSVDRLAHHG